MSAKARLRRVDTRLVKPAPAVVEPLLLHRDDGEGEGSPLMEAAKGGGLVLAVITAALVLLLWGLARLDWLGL